MRLRAEKSDSNASIPQTTAVVDLQQHTPAGQIIICWICSALAADVPQDGIDQADKNRIPCPTSRARLTSNNEPNSIHSSHC